MNYKGEHVTTLDTQTATEYLAELKIQKPLPPYKKSLTLGVEGQYSYELVNVGKGRYNIETVYIDMRSKK